jgi:hypothetical protein
VPNVVQTSLFDLGITDHLAGGALGGMIARRALGRGAWVDLLPGWIGGASALFEDLLEQVPWQAERRQMYERVVDVPRLLSFYGENDPLPHPDLVTAREVLNAHYDDELGEPFTTAIQSLGTATPSGAASPRTRWWRSSRSVRRGTSCCAHEAAAQRSGICLATAI